MLMAHVVQTEADKVFVNFLNVQAVTVSAGDVIAWDVSAPDGVRASQPVTATLSLFVGVVDADTAASAYGLAQAYGYRAAGALLTNDTSVAVVAGDILVPVNAQDRVARSAASNGTTGFLYAGEAFATATTPAAALKKVFIRAL
jgi:hypothetical protein